MGWNISHGSNQYGEERRSYTTISNLGRHLENCLSGRLWRMIQHLFGRTTGDPIRIHPDEAFRIAGVLNTAAKNPRMPAEWADLARLLADAADRAWQAGETWEWR